MYKGMNKTEYFICIVVIQNSRKRQENPSLNDIQYIFLGFKIHI